MEAYDRLAISHFSTVGDWNVGKPVRRENEREGEREKDASEAKINLALVYARLSEIRIRIDLVNYGNNISLR